MALIDVRGNPFEPLVNMLMAREQQRMQQEQIAMQQQQLKLQQDAFKLEEQQQLSAMSRQAQQDAAAGSAGQLITALIASQNTGIQQQLEQRFPQTRLNTQALGSQVMQTMRGGAPIVGGGNAGHAFDAQRIPGAQAAIIAPALQQFQQQQAEVKQAETQTRATQQAIDHAEILLPLQQENLQASTDASRASAAESRARAEEIAARRQQLPIERARERQAQFGQFMQITGDPGLSSLLAFGTNQPPAFDALVAEEASWMTRAEAGAAGDANALTQLYDERDRTRIAQALGLASADQNWLDQQAARVGDPLALYNLAKEAVGEEESTIQEEDLPKIGLYLQARFPDFELPPPEVSLLKRLFRRLASAASAAPVAASTPGAPAPSPRAFGDTNAIRP